MFNIDVALRRAAFSAIALAQSFGAFVAAQTPTPQEYEITAKYAVSHSDIREGAEPVKVEDAAAGHAVSLVSFDILQKAVDKFRLDELTSFQDIAENEVANEIFAQLDVSGKPSDDDPSVSVLEIRCRTTNYVDGLTISKAIVRCYQEFLDEPPTANDAAMKLMSEAYDELVAESGKLRNEGKTTDAERVDELSRIVKARTDVFRLKRRVGRFEVREIGEAVAVKVEPK